MRVSLLLAVTVAALACALSATAAPASATKICGQIKNGPHASYWSVVSGIKQKDGTTWTVLATGVSCAKALKGSKALFGPWQKAKLGARLPYPGYTCVKMIDSSYDGKGKSSGGGLCRLGATPATSIVSPGTFAFRMTGVYTIAQIKAFFHIS